MGVRPVEKIRKTSADNCSFAMIGLMIYQYRGPWLFFRHDWLNDIPVPGTGTIQRKRLRHGDTDVTVYLMLGAGIQ